jgi:phosphatidylserine/phosphatidylglycerophosphate/cardiolipin synthase-like enzyme
MPDPGDEGSADALLAELYPLATQAARILDYLVDFPEGLVGSDIELSSRVGEVSAEHVAIVRRSLLKADFATQENFSTKLTLSPAAARTVAENLKGIAAYLRIHSDRNSVQLVLTEPGEKSILRKAIDGMHALSPIVFQTSDAFFNLARSAKRDLVVLAPFIDTQGADLLVELFSICGPDVRRHLVCRPLSEPQCGDAFRRRVNDFRRLSVAVYEYALPSSLPSGRETFHAKIVLADDLTFYVGSSNFMGSALERSFECGVVVAGAAAKELHSVLEAVRSIAKPLRTY